MEQVDDIDNYFKRYNQQSPQVTFHRTTLHVQSLHDDFAEQYKDFFAEYVTHYCIVFTDQCVAFYNQIRTVREDMNRYMWLKSME